MVRRGVHEQHTEQHNVTGDTASFRVVDLKGNLRTDLTLLYVEEAEKVSYLSGIDSARLT